MLGCMRGAAVPRAPTAKAMASLPLARSLALPAAGSGYAPRRTFLGLGSAQPPTRLLERRHLPAAPATLFATVGALVYCLRMAFAGSFV